MSIESNKTLGGVEAILLAIPFTNLIGITIALIAMKRMADYYNNGDIFKNVLLGFILGVVGFIALIAVILILIFGFAIISPVVTPFAGWGLVLFAFIVLCTFSLIGAIFYKKSLDIISEKSEEQMFNTGGLILLIGAIISIIDELLK